MAEHNAVYQMAGYYDIALRRDVTPEIDFVCDVFEAIHGRRLASALEIACGPAYHARALARQGIQAVGLDLRPEMIAYAEQQALADGIQLTLLVADMRQFSLAAPVDMAFAMFDAIDALSSNEDLVQHLNCVADNLVPGGLYLIDVTHPRDVSLTSYGQFRYAGDRDGIKVEINWATSPPQLDLVRGVYQTGVAVHVDDHGRHLDIQDVATERLLMPQEFQLLAMLSGRLQVVAWYGDYRTSQPLDMSPASRRMIVIMQKR